MDLNKRFCELEGIPYHITDRYPQVCTCGAPNCKERNIDYSSDPIAVLRVMQQRNDYYQFIGKCGSFSEDGISYDVHYDIASFIETYLMTPGAMLEAAIAFLEEHHG